MKEGGGKDWLLTQALTGIKKPFKKSQLDALRLAIRLVDKEERTAEPEPEPSHSLRDLSDDALNSLIQKLGGSVVPAPGLEMLGEIETKPREISKAAPVPSPTLSGPPPDRKSFPPRGGDLEKMIADNIQEGVGGRTPISRTEDVPAQPQLGDKRRAHCDRHGDYVCEYVRQRWDGTKSWSYCPKCIAAAAADERWLGSLLPGG
jgi:hypothetical protein